MDSEAQIAYSISRKVGNAVVRNRIRRRLRNAFTQSLHSHPGLVGAAMVIILPAAKDRSYAELDAQVKSMLKKIEKSKESTS